VASALVAAVSAADGEMVRLFCALGAPVHADPEVPIMHALSHCVLTAALNAASARAVGAGNRPRSGEPCAHHRRAGVVGCEATAAPQALTLARAADAAHWSLRMAFAGDRGAMAVLAMALAGSMEDVTGAVPRDEAAARAWWQCAFRGQMP
jgi:hypothetical protein